MTQPGNTDPATAQLIALETDIKEGRINEAIAKLKAFNAAYPTDVRVLLIDALIARYPPYSQESEELAAALYGTSETLRIDPEGRVVLTDTLKAHAGITDQVAFVGLGHKFRIWEPERLKAHLAEATRRVRELRQAIGSRAGNPEGTKA